MCHTAAGAVGQLRGYGSGLRARTGPWDHSASHITGQLAAESLLPFQRARDEIFDLMTSFSKPQLDKL